MKRTILNTAFLFLTLIASGQIQLFKNYNFEKGGYSILGTLAESDPNGLADSIGDFYTDDISILNEFKKEWTFKKPSPRYACGYHYIVYICKDGLSIENFAINLNCNEIATDKGCYYFEMKQLRIFKNKLKTPDRKYKEFTSLTEARNARAKMLLEKDLIMTYTPDWVKFQGEFNFNYTCKKGSGDCMDQEKKLLKQLNDELKKAYPDQFFELEAQGGSNTELLVNVKCYKTLADKFTLYPFDFKKWEPYTIGLRSYWRTK